MAEFGLSKAWWLGDLNPSCWPLNKLFHSTCRVMACEEKWYIFIEWGGEMQDFIQSNKASNPRLSFENLNTAIKAGKQTLLLMTSDQWPVTINHWPVTTDQWAVSGTLSRVIKYLTRFTLTSSIAILHNSITSVWSFTASSSSHNRHSLLYFEQSLSS